MYNKELQDKIFHFRWNDELICYTWVFLLVRMIHLLFIQPHTCNWEVCISSLVFKIRIFTIFVSKPPHAGICTNFKDFKLKLDLSSTQFCVSPGISWAGRGPGGLATDPGKVVEAPALVGGGTGATRGALKCKTSFLPSASAKYFCRIMSLHSPGNFTIDYMDQAMNLWLSCYLVLLSTDSKTR